ncbi:MAG: glycosyl transferase family protein [Betaproteobacteria bacterium]|nr:glycosyl transferase family protein [Betaproteobacteria bacterium]
MESRFFSEYIQVLGKGRRGMRNLSQEEARDAMAQILSGSVEPVQLGAFLMLMRVKEESAAEVAGLVQAARASLPQPPAVAVDLDWSSYAGKRRQLPWHVLAALLLASHGHRVFMHGIGGGTAGRVYVPQALSALGLSPAASLSEAATHLKQRNFAFMTLDAVSPMLQGLLDLKSVLGLRSPVHTVVRMLNPLRARAALMGIFHPGYDDTHQEAALLLGDADLAVFKGEGGEPERNPDSPCNVKRVRDGQPLHQEWPAQFAQRHLKDESMDCLRLPRLWRGEIEDEYGTAAVVGTAAIALSLLERETPELACARAADLWQRRPRHFLDGLETVR